MDKLKTGELIKQARTEKGYTQTELGDLIGVSNKAVSRWENGESFPDIGLLERLSEILDLKIQDIVVGKVCDNSESAITEVVRVAKIQERDKHRKNVIIGLMLSVFVYLMMIAYLSFSGNLEWNWLTTLLSLAAVLAVVSCVLEKRNLSPFQNHATKCTFIVSIATAMYAIIVTLVFMFILVPANALIVIELSLLGPNLNMQYMIVFVMNSLALFSEYFRTKDMGPQVHIGTYISVAVVHLMFLYSEILHRISMPKEVYELFLWASIIVFVETGILAILFLIIKKKKRNII